MCIVKYIILIFAQMEDTLWASLTDSYAKLPMALTAEKLSEQYNITREQCDEFALSSQQRWAEGESLNESLQFCCANERNMLRLEKY